VLQIQELSTLQTRKGEIARHALKSSMSRSLFIVIIMNHTTSKCEVESPVFPTAAIAAYLQKYSGLLPEGFLDRITKSSLDYLMSAPVRMQMADAEMLAELVRRLPPGQRAEPVRKLRTVIATILVRDPTQWSTYNPQPLMFVQAPDSPLYAGLEHEVAVHLDYLIVNQQSDGGWALNWSWEKSDPAAWELAKREWRGTVALQNLEKLEAFHRVVIEQHNE
jgi:hypothetical protein